MKRYLFLLLCCFFPVWGCTDFVVMAEDRTQVNGRSMEFGYPFDTMIVIHPRGESRQSRIPDNQEGMSWKGRFGYLSLETEQGEFFDGFNEKGLSVGALWFVGAGYPENPQVDKKTLSFMDFGYWVLSSFASVEEVQKEIENVSLYFHKVAPFSFVPPIHFSIHDAQGENLVIEFIDGKMQLFSNPIGVLTNAPQLPWHLTNLRNYQHLSFTNAPSITMGEQKLAYVGQGSGLLGLPGDYTPPSRFVKITYFKHFMNSPVDTAAAVNSAFHLLNTVDLPYGVVRANSEKFTDYTQWVIVKDLTHRVLYYRTYQDQNIKQLTLSEPALVKGFVQKLG